MKTKRLVRRLGLDRNPLRRRSDKIAVYLAALLVAVFLIGAPLLSVAAVGWVGRAGAAGQQRERSWRQVPAVLLQAAPAPAVAGGAFGYSWVPAGGGHRTGGRGPVRSRSAPPWPPAIRSRCWWTPRARRPVLRRSTAR